MSLPIKRTISIEIELPFALRVADGIYDCKLDGSGFCAVVKCVEHPKPAVPLPPGKKEGVSVIFTPFTGAVRQSCRCRVR